jgi:glutaredoxin
MTNLTELAIKDCPYCKGAGKVWKQGTLDDQDCPACQHTIAVAQWWGNYKSLETLDVLVVDLINSVQYHAKKILESANIGESS